MSESAARGDMPAKRQKLSDENSNPDMSPDENLDAALKKQQSVFTKSQETHDGAIKASGIIANKTAAVSKPYSGGIHQSMHADGGRAGVP
ncbi:polycomb protein eed-A-like isoform X2 [Mobula hypostoma]|uniref:polycomb protein eed-A-like isoform X2 n=1 Tax=Mobula hypostoma TaxID=723540 RepID=UPI002FC304E1